MTEPKYAMEITELGNPILRVKTKEITDPFQPEIQQLIDDMLDTVVEARGVGIAAPQVGVDYQLFVMTPNISHHPPHDSLENGLVIINPQYKPLNDKMDTDWEGCLSIPGIRGLVPRYKSILATFTNRLGETVTTEFHDFIARIFQHEYDHLIGTVFLDRLTSNKDIITDHEYQKLFEDEDEEE
jgi:peptide deformylase